MDPRMMRGERYRCSDPRCGCVIEVVQSTALSAPTDRLRPPLCCCGREMMHEPRESRVTTESEVSRGSVIVEEG